jgi:hypothetical protein
MAGGTWIDQNKVLPGVYINYSSAPSTLATMGERGVVCIPKALGWGEYGKFIVINDPSECFDKLGYDQMDDHMIWLRQLLIGTNRTSGASKILVWRLEGTSGVAATATETSSSDSLTVTAQCKGTRGNDITVVVSADPDNTPSKTIYYVQTLVSGKLVDSQTLKADAATVALSGLVDNKWVKFTKVGNAFAANNITLRGGVDGTIPATAYSDFFTSAELETWNVLAFTGDDDYLKSSAASFVKRLSNDEGKKVQAVINDYATADNECVVSVYPQNIIDNTGHQFTNEEMVCWVAGCTAGANVNESLTYAAHPDAVEVTPVLTQTQQIQALNAGQFALFEEFGTIKNIQDINTFTSFAATKGKQFRKNRVIRTLFGICNDAYRTFSLYYVGNTNNDAVGRGLLKAELLNLLLRYQGNNALQNVVADDVVVSPGQDSDSVLIEMYIQPVDSIEKIYINITIS